MPRILYFALLTSLEVDCDDLDSSFGPSNSNTEKDSFFKQCERHLDESLLRILREDIHLQRFTYGSLGIRILVKLSENLNEIKISTFIEILQVYSSLKLNLCPALELGQLYLTLARLAEKIDEKKLNEITESKEQQQQQMVMKFCTESLIHNFTWKIGRTSEIVRISAALLLSQLMAYFSIGSDVSSSNCTQVIFDVATGLLVDRNVELKTITLSILRRLKNVHDRFDKCKLEILVESIDCDDKIYIGLARELIAEIFHAKPGLRASMQDKQGMLMNVYDL